MRFSALVLIVCVVSGCASSNLGRGLNVAVVGSGVADLATTTAALDRGAREWNRLMGDSEIRHWLLKSAGAGAVIGMAHLVELRGKPIWGYVVRGVAVGAWTWAALHNQGVNR